MATAKYEHFIKPVPHNPDYINNLNMVLINSMAELRSILDNNENFIAFDTETTGLNAEEDTIVGYSFAFNNRTGYYVPVDHAIGNSLGKEALDLFYKRLLRCKMVFMANARFDMRMMEYAGYSFENIKIYDVLQILFLSDTNVKFPSLKKEFVRYTGADVNSFEETLGDNYNFKYLHPDDAYQYAALDAIMTYHLAQVSTRFYKEAGLSAKLDNEFLYPLMRFENEGILIDTDYLQKMVDYQSTKIRELEETIYKEVGYVFKIGSGKQLSDALERLGVDTGKRVKSGYMKTDIATLEHCDSKDNPKPIISALVEWKQLNKSMSSYSGKMLELANEKDDKRLRFAYQTTNVPCLTERNKVYIKGKGLISIRDVSEGDYIHTQYGFKKVVWNNKKWAEKVYKITLQNGMEMEGTGHHPVLVNLTGRKDKVKFEWSGLTSLIKGEKVVCNHHEVVDGTCKVKLPRPNMEKVRNKFEVPEYLTPQMARLIGFIDGDGSLLPDRIKLCYSKDEKELFRYSQLMLEVFNIENYTEEDSVERNSIFVHNFFVSSLSRYLKELGCRSNKVPDCIMQGGPEIWLNYIAGYWDADGTLLDVMNTTIESYKYCPRITSKEHGRVKDLQIMLSNLNIDTTLVIKGKEDKNPRLDLRVRGKQGRDWFKTLVAPGLWSDKKRLRALSNPDEGPYYDTTQSSFESIEESQADWVYDIEVEEVHEYVSGGIVTHNSGRLSAGADGKNKFFAPYNIQSTPKPSVAYWYVHDYKEGDTVYEGDKIIYGYRFSLVDKSNKQIEAFDQLENMRSAFLPDPDHYWVSLDYSA